jgi:hypothetical protein
MDDWGGQRLNSQFTSESSLAWPKNCYQLVIRNRHALHIVHHFLQWPQRNQDGSIMFHQQCGMCRKMSQRVQKHYKLIPLACNQITTSSGLFSTISRRVENSRAKGLGIRTQREIFVA